MTRALLIASLLVSALYAGVLRHNREQENAQSYERFSAYYERMGAIAADAADAREDDRLEKKAGER